MEQNSPAPGTLAYYVPSAPISPRTILWSGLTGMAIALPLICLIGILPLPGLDAENVAANAKRMAPLYAHPLVMVLKAVIIMPLVEEFLYRGLLLQVLRRAMSLGWAVGLLTFLFAMTHLGFGFPNAVLAVVLGGYFSWLVIRSGSLLASVLCHAGVNLCALFVINPIGQAYGLTSLSSLLHPLPLLWIGVAVAVFVAGVRILQGEFQWRSLATAA